eukprot:gene963-945_t
MGVDALRQALPGIAHVPRPQRLSGGLVGQWRLAPVVVAGLEGAQTFFFAGRELRRVEFVADASELADSGAAAYGELLQFGRASYGPETAANDPSGSYAAWTRGDLEVYAQRETTITATPNPHCGIHRRAVANVGALVARSARAHARRMAVKSPARSITYADLEQRTNRLANALLGLGLERGDRVGIYLPNCVEVVEIEIACYKAGLIKAPFNARLSPTEVGAIAANSGAALIVTTTERAETIRPHVAQSMPDAMPQLLLTDDAGPTGYEAALAQASDSFAPMAVFEDEVAVLHYTSGSSGVLKAAMQTFGNRLAQLRKFLTRSDGQQPGHILGLVGPITHASGMQMVPALCQGVTIRLFNGFEPPRFIADMRADRVTHTFMVPTMINMLLTELEGQYRPLPDLLRLGYGAAPMAPARILQAMDVFGPILQQGYGAGETTSGVCGLSVEDHLFARAARPERLASCGRPFLECDVQILGDDGQPVATGEIGEIVVRGDDIFAGYWRAPELTAEAGRAPGADTTAAIDAFCAQHLGGFKRPRRIEFVTALPKNPNGKVMRRAVQAPYWEGRGRMVN